MQDHEILRCIDDGANYYLDFFADATHMQSTDNGYYTIICPKESEQGIKFIYNLRLDRLSGEVAQAKIAGIKSLSLPVWWPIHAQRVQRLLHGKDYLPQPPTESDEFCMALLPENRPDIHAGGAMVRRVEGRADFRLWADIANRVFADGYRDIHPENHYHWCEKGWLIPYIAYCEGMPVAIASILNNDGTASLELVATLDGYRRGGLARAACTAAIENAFSCGARIITLRAFHPANLLYQSLGFRAYY